MFENMLDEVLVDYYKEEFSLYTPAKEYKMSLRRRLAMKKIFKHYKHNVGQRNYSDERTSFISGKKFILTPKRIAFLVMIILLAALAGCTTAYYISQSFRGEVHSDNTELFPINTENCPTTIEEKYFLPEIPEGYEVLQTDSTPFSEYISYINKQTGQTISFSQYVKSEFTFHYNTEKGELIEVEINGHYGIFLSVSDEENITSGVIWDNGDYILQVYGDLTKEETINLAKSAKLSENLK